MVASITGVVALTGILPTSAQTVPSATRSINPATVAPGGTVTVTIEAGDYGQAGGVTETLPAGFAYETSSLSTSQVNESGQDVRFTLQGDTSFTYTVTASGTAGSYSFSGTLRDFERDDYPVGGDSSVTVEAPSTTTPSATRSINPATVAPGGTVTVTIEAGDYGQAGGVTETLPAGFAYETSSLSTSQVNESGQDVRFTLQGDTSFTYTVTASGTAGSYSFSGTLRDFERDDYPVGGDSSVTVEAPSTTTPSATRSINPATVAPGGTVTVTIEAGDYGQAGGVTETLPAGFAYETSSLSTSQVNESGQDVRFTLQGDTSFTYTVTASGTAGSYSFSGTLRDFERDDYPVGGDSSVTVEAPSTTTPSATRSINPATVAPGGTVTVTIEAGDYGQAGGVTETLPAGFAYETSSLSTSQVNESGQDVRFTLQGDTSFTYTVTASGTAGSYSFSGTLRDFERDDYPVGGDSSVTVEAPSTTTPSATRSINPATVAPGGTVTVTIEAGDYGQAGGVTETLPAGFAYETSSLSTSQVNESGQDVRFTLQGDNSFTYTVTASGTAGSYSFSGTLRDFERDDYPVGGDSSVTVEAPSTTTPSATRSINPATVAPGGTVTVTIQAADYGQAGGVTETLPAGFAYVSSSLIASQVNESGQDVRFTLQGDTSFTYTVTASETAGSYSFSGTLRDFERDDYAVGGDSSVTVEAPSTTIPSATRRINPATVAPGGTVRVTIQAADYGQTGVVTETLPAGFAYVTSSLSTSQVNESGQDVRFTLQGDNSVTYTVTASETAGSYSFSGTLKDFDGIDYAVGGATVVTVRGVVPEPDPEPQVNQAPAFPGSSTTRFIEENSPSGANVGAQVRATDADDDRLTYSLNGTDAGSFTINSGGQIMVGTGTMLDFEDKASYMVTVRATDPDNASDTISVTVTVGNVDEQGRVTLWAGTAVALTTPSVDQEIMAQVEDSDGNPGTTTFPIPMYTVITAGNVTGWQWARADAPSDGSAPAADATWTDISGAMNAAYTPAAADSDKFLKATAMYNDGEGSGKTAMGMTGSAVGATPTTDPVAMYDTDGTAGIQKAEFETALRDYISNQTLDKAGFEQVLRSYLGL